MSQISNEQIAHDLAIAYISEGWREGKLSENKSVKLYFEKYEQFLRDISIWNS